LKRPKDGESDGFSTGRENGAHKPRLVSSNAPPSFAEQSQGVGIGYAKDLVRC
jgi:hypothetical protein